MPRPATLALTSAQREFWLAQHLAPDSSAFSLGCYFEIHGGLDLTTFETVVRSVVEATDTLQVRIIDTADEGPRQLVERRPTALAVVDVSEHADPQAAAVTWMQDDMAQRLAPAEGKLFRQAIFVLAPDEHWWYLRANHVVMDGYGVYLLARRVADVYSGTPTGQGTPTGSFGSLAEVVDADLAYRESQEFQVDRAHWMREFAERPEVVTPSTRPPAPASHAARITAHIPQDQFEGLVRVATECGVRWPAVVIAATVAYLSKVMGTDDVAVGLTVTGRSSGVARSTPAQLSNVLPLRVGAASHRPFRTVARDCGAAMLGALQAQQYRGEDIRRDLAVRGNEALYGWHLNINPLDYRLPIPECNVVLHPLALGPVDDAVVYVYSNTGGSGLRVDFDAHPDRYTPQEMEAHLRRLLLVVRQVAEGRATFGGRLDTVGPDEWRQLMASEWNSSHYDPEPVSVMRLFERKVQERPDALAVTAGRESVSYTELNSRANRLARWLVQLGVRVDDVVGVGVPRSVEMVVSVLAVLKAGAAYLPIDLEYPPDRIAYILRDSNVSVVLTTHQGVAYLPMRTDAELFFVDDPATRERLATLPDTDLGDEDRSGPVDPANLAYVIYTSGSTGNPKGVAVQHRSVTNYVTRAVVAYPSLGSGVLLYSSLSFDITLTALFGALAAGGHLIISSVEDYTQHMGELGEYAFLKATPTHLALLDTLPDLCSPQEEFIVAGEPLVGEALMGWRRRHPDAELINHYGPSECTCGCVDYRIPASEPIPSGPIPIGRPFADTRLFVLDSGLRPVPVGVVGELYISGDCLARGYLNRPNLTAERFVADPFGGPGRRMYRTGDTVVWRPDGYVEFVGRADHQIKLRGFRVELGEVQAAIAAHPAVAEVIVIVSHGGTDDKHLVGYVSPIPGARLEPTDLREFLGRSLASYMVPAHFVVLDSLPKTPNGKIDRKALPAPARARGGGFVVALTAPEELACLLLGEVLVVPEVGATDNFFDLGGNSLHAVKLAARLSKVAGRTITVRDVFEQQTAARLATLIADVAETPLNAPSTGRPDRVPLALHQRRLWFLNQSDIPPSVYNIPFVGTIDGDFDTAAFGLAVADVVERHEILRTVFPQDDEGVHQVVVGMPELDFRVEVSEIDPADLHRLLLEYSRMSFDLTRDPPFRAWLFTIGPGRHVLLIVFHHIAGDGWSFAPFARDLEAAYAARRAGRAPDWEPLPYQYFDYAVSQQRLLLEAGSPSSGLRPRSGVNGDVARAP